MTLTTKKEGQHDLLNEQAWLGGLHADHPGLGEPEVFETFSGAVIDRTISQESQKPRWQELCEQAINEQDRQRFLDLLGELRMILLVEQEEMGKHNETIDLSSPQGAETT